MFILPGAKRAKKVDVQSALAQAVVHEQGQGGATGIEDACRAFQNMRSAVHQSPTSEQAAARLRKYLCAVEYVQEKLKDPSSFKTPLLWFNGFDGNDYVEVADLTLDRVATAYSLGVCYARLAAAKYATGMGNACKEAAILFRDSAGWFRTAHELPAPAQVTSDLSSDGLQALMYTMLGNGQQLMYNHACQQGAKEGLVARYAGGARDFYESAGGICAIGGVAGSAVDQVVGKSARALSLYFKMIAMGRQARQYNKDNDMANELKQLEDAKNAAVVAVQAARALPNSGVLLWMGKLREDVLLDADTWEKRLGRKLEEAHHLARTTVFISAARFVPTVTGRKALEAVNKSGKIEAEESAVVQELAGL